MTEEEATKICADRGYSPPVLLASGEWACVGPFIFTFGLLVGLDKYSFRTRFCYESLAQALVALVTWDGTGDPPGDWIKEKGRMERNNPKRFQGIPILEERRTSSDIQHDEP